MHSQAGAWERKKIASIKHIIMLPNTFNEKYAVINNNEKKIYLWHKLLDIYKPKKIRFTLIDFNDPIYIVYSSGTTGAPKSIIHGAGNILLMHSKEHQLHCDIKANDRIFYFTTCAWMMWNWQISALYSGASLVIYDGFAFVKKLEILFDYAKLTKTTLFGISAKYLEFLQKNNCNIKKKSNLFFLKAYIHFIYIKIFFELHINVCSVSLKKGNAYLFSLFFKTGKSISL